ncbi:hypothetical protein COCSUDRAFT_62329 [Coccomyxa subellipsoidea C-169]|uniref:Uncharacterized protein n=1 Tax=Coccomyxa subellipsoidea (strain C-169) TaxID=574566 RepID=I0Z2P9_COCSC|nr:hypothetical protein COCSUDRAFT_62329 [Coccomyxa subellipsoidea C-169]EIE24918.1 hypothetical protein COCSUDRAFT_62329 [Coccomyxa subellipsoidea C-169]|eukprot:XP_005649462.1 hypothetical protein COCSUDRAFT_62329 [Coccomyxa subellipsoidea C-169]
MTLATATFFGTTVPTQKLASRNAGRKSVVTEAKSVSKNVQRGLNSEVRKAKKLLPWDQKLFDTAPGRAKNMSNARNVPRKGGFGGGGAYQKISKNIPSAAGTKPWANVDPLLYVGGLIGVFLALTVPTILSNGS